ncbi:hypothetical protein E8E13_004250 [Curvularia kusanoi]|uniref:Uncharacterized protein n=1 Tax=Curvularia kusanoi TaxID=90978 RepID=A0A9P4TK13_CURKU|nr:hypothetical protein E8E13_004250 [Curvularia kusanoi]
MAPISADVARPAPKQQARRPISRIVPAIPHRLSRRVPAATPVAAAPAHKDAATQQGQDSEPQAQQPTVEEKKPQEQAAQAPQSAQVAESKAAAEETEPAVEAVPSVLASSPVESPGEEVRQPTEAQGESIASPAVNDDVSRVHEAPPADVESKLVTNGVLRKELPPPFYPSSMSGVNTPVAENHDSMFHPPQPNVDGGLGTVVQDLPQPATPQAYEVPGHGHRQSVPRIPPGFAPPDFTPSFFPGHSHHHSDAGAPWLYPPYSMPPPPEPMFGNGTDFQSPPFTSGPPAYPEPYAPHFSPEDPRFAMNGVASSNSQSPSKSQFGEPLPLPEHVVVQHSQHQPNGGGPRSEEMSESPFELASYLSTQFGNPEFADFVLQIRSPEYQYISIPVHGIVVVRSPVIANAVRRSIPPAHRSRDSRRLVDVLTTNPFVTTESVQEAIKVLYGAPLLSMQAFLYGLGHYSPDMPHAHAAKDARKRMDQLLSYIAAGSVLQITSMQARGVEIAKALLRWDTVEQVLHYGLDTARSIARSRPKDSDYFDPFAEDLLHSTVDFMAYNFPADFTFYRLAAELRNDPRLPSLSEDHAPTHNPRLSKIRFGDAPTDDDTQISPLSRTLSSVLLSLPLRLVYRLLNHRATANQIGVTGVAKVLHDVVDEREIRRHKVLRNQLEISSTASSELVDNLYVEERVEHVGSSPERPSGYVVVKYPVNGRA